MKFLKTSINKNGQQFIQCREESVDDDGVVTATQGFIEVAPEKADGLIAKLQNGERKAEFGAKNRTTGLYEVIVSKVEAETAA